ncbi:MAG: PilZ domain-containing protein [Anaerolineaceae bacterium]|nr:PilZ domain-containing protein [Anaerolineaceae bacterium]
MADIASKNTPLELTNVYNGVTITQEARILSLGEDFVELQTPYYQFMCVALQGHTHLHSPGLPCMVSADLKGLELTSGKIRLRNFSCLSRLSEVRLAGRVAPQEPIRTILHLKNKDFSASVADLSTSGIGIWAYKIREKGINLEPNSLINLDYYLPRQSKKFTLKGKVAYLKPAKSSIMFRLGVCVKPNNEQENKLQEYIRLRHQDILRELEQAFNRSFEPLRTANMFY